ncbi:hypothetical protein [Yaniella halotolerans]|uniref:hypothetical protein n=1 Tax=Yaniella halotolerans TaxID=225453 RepID=UPI0003B7A272|nr:hypothetical protein [Yaniella halotolerans]
MKRSFALMFVGALALTACTDQPVPPEPTVSAPSSPETSETAMTPEVLTDNIAELMEHPKPEQIPTGDEALESFTAVLLPEQAADGSQCPPVTVTKPETSGFGQLSTRDEDDEEESQSLGAFEFPSADEAEAFTAELQNFIDECSALDSEIEPLNHHTDDAFELQIERDDDTASSMVILRDKNTVLVASSTPPADVALSLTLTDQLQEMLR